MFGALAVIGFEGQSDWGWASLVWQAEVLWKRATHPETPAWMEAAGLGRPTPLALGAPSWMAAAGRAPRPGSSPHGVGPAQRRVLGNSGGPPSARRWSGWGSGLAIQARLGLRCGVERLWARGLLSEMTIHPSTRFHLRKMMSATNFTDLIMGAYALDIGGAPALARPSHQSFRWGRIGVSPRVSHFRPDPRSQSLGNQRVRKAAFGSLHPLHGHHVRVLPDD